MDDTEFWYCQECDAWSSDPEDYTQYRADDTGKSVNLLWKKGQRVKLSKYIKANVIFDHLDYDLDLSDDIQRARRMSVHGYASELIPQDKKDELQQLLKQWCDSIDYPWWEYDSEGEEVTESADPQD